MMKLTSAIGPQLESARIFRLKNNDSGVEVRMVRRTEGDFTPPNFAYDVHYEGKRIVPLAEQAGWEGNYHLPNVLGDIEYAVSFDAIDLGNVTAKGIGLAIMSFFAALAQARALDLQINTTSNMDLIRLLERVSATKFQAIAETLFWYHTTKQNKHSVGIRSSREKIRILFDPRTDLYWSENLDRRTALLYFAFQKGKGNPLGFVGYNYTSDATLNQTLRQFLGRETTELTFAPDGRVIIDGQSVGYACELGFQLHRLFGRHPRPDDCIEVEVEEDDPTYKAAVVPKLIDVPGQPFMVMEKPVSVGLFAQFVRETGYKIIGDDADRADFRLYWTKHDKPFTMINLEDDSKGLVQWLRQQGSEMRIPTLEELMSAYRLVGEELEGYELWSDTREWTTTKCPHDDNNGKYIARDKYSLQENECCDPKERFKHGLRLIKDK